MTDESKPRPPMAPIPRRLLNADGTLDEEAYRREVQAMVRQTALRDLERAGTISPEQQAELDALRAMTLAVRDVERADLPRQ